MSGQPEALRLADEYEYEGFIGKHQFAREEWCRKAALELRRLHTENASLSTGYDAARLEIESLKAKAQEQEELLAAVGAGGVEPLRRADHLRGVTKMVPSDHLRGATKMTLDEAIEHADEVAGCGAQCGVEHAQLAAWLRELRDRSVNAD